MHACMHAWPLGALITARIERSSIFCHATVAVAVVRTGYSIQNRKDGTPMMSGGMGWREPPHPGSTALCSVRGLPGGQVSGCRRTIMRNFFPAVFPGDAVILLAQQCPIYYYHTMRQKNHCIPTIIILHKSGRSTRTTSL